MKKILTISVFFLFIVGITGFYLFQLKQVSPKEVVATYYTDFMQQKYAKAAELIADHQLQLQQVTKESWAAAEKQAEAKNSLKITGFQLDFLKDQDATHKQGKVTLNTTIGPAKRAITEQFMLVLEKGSWKMDFSGLVGTPVPLPISIQSKDYAIHHISIIKNTAGITILFTLENLSPQNAIRIGVQRFSTGILDTDQGAYNLSLARNMIMPKQSIPLQLRFDHAKGDPKTLTTDECYLTGIDGIPKKNILPFTIKIPFS
jgi:nitrogen regulatory protein PII-like uncharacterized protein